MLLRNIYIDRKTGASALKQMLREAPETSVTLVADVDCRRGGDGLIVGDHKVRIALNGHQVRTGVARFGGSTKQTVRLPVRAKDTSSDNRPPSSHRLQPISSPLHHFITPLLLRAA